MKDNNIEQVPNFEEEFGNIDMNETGNSEYGFTNMTESDWEINPLNDELDNQNDFRIFDEENIDNYSNDFYNNLDHGNSIDLDTGFDYTGGSLNEDLLNSQLVNNDIETSFNEDNSIYNTMEEQPIEEVENIVEPVQEEELNNEEVLPVEDEEIVPIYDTMEEKDDTIESIIPEEAPALVELNEDSNFESEEEKNPVTFENKDFNEEEILEESKEEEIESTDINELFGKINTNVKEASDIFRKNSEMKKRLDEKFEELKSLQSKIEENRKQDYEEINNYKESVINKLTEKKNEIEERLTLLKDLQANFEKEKNEFEKYKIEEKTKIQDEKREQQTAYEERKEELSRLENKLRKQKDSLDEERNQLSLDKIQYEADKNELANNLLKFNELVNSFTNGMDTLNEKDN